MKQPKMNLASQVEQLRRECTKRKIATGPRGKRLKPGAGRDAANRAEIARLQKLLGKPVDSYVAPHKGDKRKPLPVGEAPKPTPAPDASVGYRPEPRRKAAAVVATPKTPQTWRQRVASEPDPVKRGKLFNRHRAEILDNKEFTGDGPNWSQRYRAETDPKKRAALYADHREDILSGN